MSIEKKLGKYELLEELGRGGFGTVYRARDTTLDVERAVKVLHAALVSDPEFIARFQREAKFAAKLEHPNIVPVYELGEIRGSYFLAMKFMPGGSLKDVLAKAGQIAFPRALQITRQIADALEFAHQQGLVHRDVKPANILLEAGDSTARLADFGFTKALSGASSASLSVSGGMLGTPSYMAPEVWSGGLVTPATDLYSLACVFFEMITGTVLFAGETPPQIMTRHMLNGPQFPEKWSQGVPDGIEKVLEKALAREPKERSYSLSDFASALEGLAVEGTPAKPSKEEQWAVKAARQKAQEEAKQAVGEDTRRQAEKFKAILNRSKPWAASVIIIIAAILIFNNLLSPASPAPAQVSTSKGVPIDMLTPSPTTIPTFPPTSTPTVQATPIQSLTATPVASASQTASLTIGKWSFSENPCSRRSSDSVVYFATFNDDGTFTRGSPTGLGYRGTFPVADFGVHDGVWSLKGDEITIIVGNDTYVGRLDGNKIQNTTTEFDAHAYKYYPYFGRTGCWIAIYKGD